MRNACKSSALMFVAVVCSRIKTAFRESLFLRFCVCGRESVCNFPAAVFSSRTYIVSAQQARVGGSVAAHSRSLRYVASVRAAKCAQPGSHRVCLCLCRAPSSTAMSYPQQNQYYPPPQPGFQVPPQGGYYPPPQQQQPMGYYPPPPPQATTVVVHEKKKDDDCWKNCCLCTLCMALCCWCCSD